MVRAAAYSKFEPVGVPVDDARYSHAANFPVTKTRLKVLTCPADFSPQRVANNGITYHNYVANYGSTIYDQIDFANVRFFGAPFFEVTSVNDHRPGVRFAEITDGLSNTMMTSETLVGLQGTNLDLRGFSHWAYAANFSGFRTPNSTKPDWMQSSGYCNAAPAITVSASSRTASSRTAVRSRCLPVAVRCVWR